MIRENIIEVRERIAKACAVVGRGSSEVTLIAITKNRQPEEILKAIENGITDIGENRVQEAVRKFSVLQQAINNNQIKRHFVGHLQTNKVKEAVELFDLIHSVDSIKLAAEIDKQAQKISKLQDILVQINTSFEESKSGFMPREAVEAVLEISKFKNIRINGLMTMAPVVENPQEARVFFKNLKDIRDKINSLTFTLYPLTHLSMGMSDDFETAIQEGATMIRVGRAIFEE
ncbi:MAG: YggS family pyridoxal phosphate-dependent enzyme [Candidatus Omnitrophica bacterium]|nr:YggS family pyridoxal phosphate-dependent enzyme [Candidatus Omnitrophota bacterium]